MEERALQNEKGDTQWVTLYPQHQLTENTFFLSCLKHLVEKMV